MREVQTVKKIISVFNGHGTLPHAYKIQLKDDAEPVVHVRLTESPSRVKNKYTGDLRVCLDPKDLNENIKVEHYQIPKREEIMNEMAGAKLFSKLDASHGFWQLCASHQVKSVKSASCIGHACPH